MAGLRKSWKTKTVENCKKVSIEIPFKLFHLFALTEKNQFKGKFSGEAVLKILNELKNY